MILIYCIVTATGKRFAEGNANGIYGVDSGFRFRSVLFLLRHATFQFLGVLLAPPNFSGCSAAFFLVRPAGRVTKGCESPAHPLKGKS